jgi:hypothetical protein
VLQTTSGVRGESILKSHEITNESITHDVFILLHLSSHLQKARRPRLGNVVTQCQSIEDDLVFPSHLRSERLSRRPQSGRFLRRGGDGRST